MRVPALVNDQYYHVFNRGIDHRNLFKDSSDYERFVESLHFFNDEHYKHTTGNRLKRMQRTVRREFIEDHRTPLVQIISYCLLPNHFHLLLRQSGDGGVSRFLHRLCMGYVKYYNLRHGRTGRLFESIFKAVPVLTEAQFSHLPRYIHLNALDLTDIQWRDGVVENWDTAEKFLNDYKWSSHSAFLGRPQQLPIVNEELVRQMFSEPIEYSNFLKNWSGRHSVPSLRDGTE